MKAAVVIIFDMDDHARPARIIRSIMSEIKPYQPAEGFITVEPPELAILENLSSRRTP